MEPGFTIKYYVIDYDNPLSIQPVINHDGRIALDKYNDCIPTPRLASFLQTDPKLWESLRMHWTDHNHDQLENAWYSSLASGVFFMVW